jgi:pyruvate-formate lyase-activating enzyme
MNANETRPLVFYGAGKSAAANLKRYKKMGLIPVCFVDQDKKKHNTIFQQEYDILSLENAFERYPDSLLVLTVANESLGEVANNLLGKGILPERLKYPDPVEWRKGCDMLGTFVVFLDDHIETCCSFQSAKLSGGNKIDSILANYQNHCRKVINDIKAEMPTHCDNCSSIRYNYWLIKPKIKVFNLSTAFKYDRCNYKCFNCSASFILKNVKSYDDEQLSVWDALTQFAEWVEMKPEMKEIKILFANGEPTLSPYFERIVGLLRKKHWLSEFFTNASIYKKSLYDLLHDGLAIIRISLDSGYSETYAKIKGVNCFDKVLANLHKYAQSNGEIVLKYIIFEGINDNVREVDKFIDIADSLGANIQISQDNTHRQNVFSHKLRELFLYFIKKIDSVNLKYSFTEEYINKVDLDFIAQIRGQASS